MHRPPGKGLYKRARACAAFSIIAIALLINLHVPTAEGGSLKNTSEGTKGICT